MKRPQAFFNLLLVFAAAVVLAGAGCTTTRSPTTATQLEPKIQAEVRKGRIEPGFTPEMVFLALGKPSEPADTLSDTASNGLWIYRDFTPSGDREFIAAGFRRHVVYDSKRKTDVIHIEPIDAATASTLPANSLTVKFREGRVVEIQRIAARG